MIWYVNKIMIWRGKSGFGQNYIKHYDMASATTMTWRGEYGFGQNYIKHYDMASATNMIRRGEYGFGHNYIKHYDMKHYDTASAMNYDLYGSLYQIRLFIF